MAYYLDCGRKYTNSWEGRALELLVDDDFDNLLLTCSVLVCSYIYIIRSTAY